MDLAGYSQRKVEDRLDRLDSDVGTLKSDVATLKTDVATLTTDVAVIRASMATKDDIIQLQRWMVTLLLPLILPIYGVLLVILIFLYKLKP